LSLKRNIAANYVGQGWRALMGVIFLPLYVSYLGVEAYGLIAIFLVLQSWLSLLDMGLKPALGREMARYTAGAQTSQSIHDLLRSIEVVSIAIAALLAVGVWAASGWLASDWVRTVNLSTDSVRSAFAIMGIVIASRFIENIYVSSIVGLQRQVLDNVLGCIMATARAVGVIGVLRWASPTIQAFFVWQALISLVTVLAYAAATYSILQRSPKPARPSVSALIGIWRYAAGMMMIALLSLILTQIDKILLSRMLTLEAFGYYALAGVFANFLYVLISPVGAAYLPRFTELVTAGDEAGLRAAYHKAAQLVTTVVGAAGLVLITFGDRVLLLWTGDPTLTSHAWALLHVLALGTLLSGLLWIPYQMQLAHGWTGLAVKINIAAACILTPAIFLVVPRFGAIGAAWACVTLNAAYLIFNIYFMHRRLLQTEKWRWYRQDVATPLVAATATAVLLRRLLPANLGRTGEIFELAGVCASVLAAAALAAPIIRRQVVHYFSGIIGYIYARS
jgi:O-antigen/teichoic acid export membrane protein